MITNAWPLYFIFHVLSLVHPFLTAHLGNVQELLSGKALLLLGKACVLTMH